MTTQDNFIKIKFMNPITKRYSSLKLDRSIVENSETLPVAVTTIINKITVTLYIDKNFTVRAVEKSIFLEENIKKTKFEEKVKISEKKKHFGKILVLGLSKAGKTCIMNRISKNCFENTLPTLGVNILKTVLENTEFVFYDIGGQEKLRDKWTTTLTKPEAIIFVFDITSSPEMIEECKNEFEKIIKFYFIDNSLTIPLLILGNKIDILVKQKISKHSIMRALISVFDPERFNINYRLGLVSALSGEGIDYNFKWLIASKLLD